MVFLAAKSTMSGRNTVVFTTSRNRAPGVVSHASSAAIAVRTCASRPSARTPPLAPVRPETMRKSPARTIGEYGPNGRGGGSVMGPPYALRGAGECAGRPRGRQSPGQPNGGCARGENGIGPVDGRFGAPRDIDLHRWHVDGAH